MIWKNTPLQPNSDHGRVVRASDFKSPGLESRCYSTVFLAHLCLCTVAQVQCPKKEPFRPRNRQNNFFLLMWGKSFFHHCIMVRVYYGESFFLSTTGMSYESIMCWGTERNKPRKKETRWKLKGRALHWLNFNKLVAYTMVPGYLKLWMHLCKKKKIAMVRLEPTTSWFQGHCSLHCATLSGLQ